MPGLVILDIRTPPPDGIDTLKWIKKHYPDQKVVMFSSSLLEEDECLEIGADGYYIKPEDLDDLGDLIRRIVREHYPVDPLSSFPV
jgi:DNA-binding NarL/FixJ family response regulator